MITMRRIRLWRSSHEQHISGNAWQSRDLNNKTIKRRAGCRQESSPTARNSTLTGVSVDCQRTRSCMERSSVEQAERAKTRMQYVCGKNSDLAGRLIKSTGHSRRIVEGQTHESSYRKQTDAVMPRRGNQKT